MARQVEEIKPHRAAGTSDTCPGKAKGDDC